MLKKMSSFGFCVTHPLPVSVCPVLRDAAIRTVKPHRPTGLILPQALSHSSVTICSIYDPILT